MSLKAFHIAFVAASTLLAFGFGAWLYQMYLLNNNTTFIVGSVLSCLTGVGLIVYGIKFLKKLKHVSFL